MMTWDEWRGSMDGRPALWIKHLFRFLGCGIDLHKMVAADDSDCYHSHPAWALRLILRGGYVEELEDGSHKIWKPGGIGIVAPCYCHRIVSLLNGRVSYSLWIKARKSAPITISGNGWKRQEQTYRSPGLIIKE